MSACLTTGIEGSPPRMRGELAKAWAGLLAKGITPAYAGRTRLPFEGLGPEADHPRVCGENCH